MNLLFNCKMDDSLDLDEAMDFNESSLVDHSEHADGSTLFEQSACKVCGDSSTGMYFGAQVCVPCKTFFLRYASDSSTFACKFNKFCVITPSNRTQCKYCRYQKCIEAGMCRRVRPMQVQINEGQQMCMVCNDVANGVHFGALTCEGCKKFFRRGLVEHKTYSCKADQKCIINPRTRNSCRYCRYVKCLSVGMSREAIQMGRPSKHKAHANALLRKKDWKVPKVEDEQDGSEWTSPANSKVKRQSVCSVSEDANVAYTGGENVSPDDGYTELPTKFSFNRRCTSIGSTHTVSDVVSGDSDSDSSSDAKYQFSSVDSRLLSVGTRNTEMMTKMKHSVSATDSTERSPSIETRNVLSPDELNRARVWSGGSCCEVRNNTCLEKSPSSNKEPLDGDWSNLHKLIKEENFSAMHLSNGQYTDSLVDQNALNATELQRHCSYPGRSIGRHTDLSYSMSPVRTVKRESSPGVRWRTNSDRDSPYISVMALASSCQLFNEACRSPLLEGEAPDFPEEVIASSDNTIVTNDRRMYGYWLHSDLPDENILFTEKHCELINRITAAYDRFVQTGTTINQTLTNELAGRGLYYTGLLYLAALQLDYNDVEMITRNAKIKNWQQLNTGTTHNLSLPNWIQLKVVPVYTVTSITYCKSLPGFTDFATEDQATLIRLGQSPSRILVACVHWYEPEKANFRNFLSWRSDLFKSKLIRYAQKIQKLEIDHIEAAVLNALTLIATDYPGLKNSDVIEDLRKQVLSAFRAYTTAKLGTPNQRIETLFKCMPEVRELGMLHFKMTMTSSLKAEEIERQ